MVLMYPRTVEKSLLQRHRQRICSVCLRRPTRAGGKVKQTASSTDLGRITGPSSSSRCSPSSDGSSPARLLIPADPPFVREAPRTGGQSSSSAPCSTRLLGLWSNPRHKNSGGAKGVPFARPRAFVLVANRLIAPASEHGLACWARDHNFRLRTARSRRLPPHYWHQPPAGPHSTQYPPLRRSCTAYTLYQLLAAKDHIEVAPLPPSLRDHLQLKPDLVLYDITITYFEGAARNEFAKHGYQPRR